MYHTEPADAARRIVEATVKRSARTMVGREARLVDVLARITPNRYWAFMRRPLRDAIDTRTPVAEPFVERVPVPADWSARRTPWGRHSRDELARVSAAFADSTPVTWALRGLGERASKLSRTPASASADAEVVGQLDGARRRVERQRRR